METRDDDAAWEAQDDDELGPEDEALDRAWSAIDAGDYEAALRELETVDPDWPDRWIPEALVRTDLGELKRARALLDRVRSAAEVDEHPDWLWAEGALCTAEWRIGPAREVLERLVSVERSAAALERLALCHDVLGEHERADELLAEAHKLNPEAVPLPARMPLEDLEAEVARALEDLPAQFRKALETTEIVVEPMPAEWMIDLADPAETPPDVLGLFVGVSDIERSEDASAELPRRIYLFQRNLERAAESREELVEEVRTTLFHEIGHLLGFDEEGVAEMGLE